MKRPRILLVISLQPPATLRADVAAGQRPQPDYDALRQAFGNEMHVMYLKDAQSSWFGRLLARYLGHYLALICAVMWRAPHYDIVCTDTEIIGLPVAFLLKLTRVWTRHVRYATVAHDLAVPKKEFFFHRLGVGRRIDTLIVYSSAHRTLAHDAFHMPEDHIALLACPVDTHFWHPQTDAVAVSVAGSSTTPLPMVCAAGQEARDYATLVKAVTGMPVEVRIAASAAFREAVVGSPRYRAPWVKDLRALGDLPSNVTIGPSDGYADMRALYTRAAFVVVPLYDLNAAIGVTVIQEAMAMGKAVIASGIRGQTDYLRDRRNHGRGRMERPWWPGILDAPGVVETYGSLPTGFYVTPGDPAELRRAIQYLLDHPEVAEELGRNGRRVVEQCFSLEAFVKRFSVALLGAQELEPDAIPGPTAATV